MGLFDQIEAEIREKARSAAASKLNNLQSSTWMLCGSDTVMVHIGAKYSDKDRNIYIDSMEARAIRRLHEAIVSLVVFED